MADSRHLEKIKNCHISAAKFGLMARFDPLDRADRLVSGREQNLRSQTKKEKKLKTTP